MVAPLTLVLASLDLITTGCRALENVRAADLRKSASLRISAFAGQPGNIMKSENSQSLHETNGVPVVL